MGWGWLAPLDLDETFCTYWVITAAGAIDIRRIVLEKISEWVQWDGKEGRCTKKQIGHSMAPLYRAASSVRDRSFEGGFLVCLIVEGLGVGTDWVGESEGLDCSGVDVEAAGSFLAARMRSASQSGS
jgi:hypothetical protein